MVGQIDIHVLSLLLRVSLLEALHRAYTILFITPEYIILSLSVIARLVLFTPRGVEPACSKGTPAGVLLCSLGQCPMHR